MSDIHVLDPTTVNKIAAGEVVERPASVIKELVENAMDAGATQIEVEVMAGGTSFMRVTDNGKGMTEANAKLAIERHATSKIREASDLNSILTLGFRGEALPAIASVSRFLLQTRPKGADLGTRVSITGGRDTEVCEMGCALGTTVQVEDLFFNTPARKKFLKTRHTEGLKISGFLTRLALSRPAIGFRYISNNRSSLVTPGNGNLYDTIGAIYGTNVAEALIALSFETEDLKITGFITKPSMLKGGRQWQTFIVNGRTIENRAIAKAIDNAYKALIPKSGFPLAVLFIEVPQRTIDVNVHPQKIEMKFEDEGRIFKGVYKAVMDAVRPAEHDLGEMAAHVDRPERFIKTMEFVPAKSTAAAQETLSHLENSESLLNKADEKFSSYSIRKSGDAPATIYEKVCSSYAADPKSCAAESSNLLQTQNRVRVLRKKEAEVLGINSPCGTLRSLETMANGMNKGGAVRETGADDVFGYAGSIVPIGQVDLTYIVAQDKTGLYIIDQHAAHERVLFDKFSNRADDIPSQQLLVHLILSFDARETEIVAENQALFARLGFCMEAAGENEFRLMEVPADIPSDEAEDAIREILVAVENSTRVSPKDIREHCLATTACHAAIKAGQELNFRQMEMLLKELTETDFPYTCPHGRPTVLKFTTGELAKMFKRTGFGF